TRTGGNHVSPRIAPFSFAAFLRLASRLPPGEARLRRQTPAHHVRERQRLPCRLAVRLRGGVAERSNAAVSKTVSGGFVRRGFKSLPLRSTQRCASRGRTDELIPRRASQCLYRRKTGAAVVDAARSVGDTLQVVPCHRRRSCLNVGAKVPPQRPLVAESGLFLADFCMALFALIVPPVLARLETMCEQRSTLSLRRRARLTPR